jgi:ribosomal protein L7/L12
MAGEFKTEVGEFKGSKTISILKEDKRVLSFGLSKAKAILASINEIKDFVAKNDKSVQPDLNVEEM